MPRAITLPHLGASTVEAEDNCAVMAADTLRDFLEQGHIRNCVNFPDAALPRQAGSIGIAIANSNVPNMVGQISTCLAERRAQYRRAAEPLARRVCLHADRCRRRGR